MPEPVFSKKEALAAIRRLGLPSPPTVSVRTSAVGHLLSKYDAESFWFLRGTMIDPPIVQLKALPDVVEKVLGADSSQELILTKKIQELTSGVLLKAFGLLFIEYVGGAPVSLLRNGATPSRMALDLKGLCLESRQNHQEFSCRWEGSKLVNESARPVGPLTTDDRQQLTLIASRCPDQTILEWITDAEGKVYIVDFKIPPPGFLIDRESILSGVRTNELLSLREKLVAGTIVRNNDATERILLLERPLSSFTKQIENPTVAVIMKAGGILSHLVLRASIRAIPALISNYWYEQCLDRKTIALEMIGPTQVRSLN